MIRFRSAVICLTLLLLSAPSVAATAPCLLVFDARTLAWTVSSCTLPHELDVQGVPTVYSDTKTTIVVEVTSINPLLYQVAIGEVTLESIPALTDLAAIFMDAGGALKALVAAAAARTDPGKFDAADLSTMLLKARASLARFLDEEAALKNAVQRLEFEESVVVTRPKDTLTTWETLFADLRAAHRSAKESGAAPASKEDLAEAAAILDKSQDAMKAMATALLVVRRGCYASGLKTCHATTGGPFTVRRTVIAWEGHRVADWDKIATYPVSVKRSAPYAASVATDAPESISTKFKVSSTQASRISVGLGLTTTDVRTPAWKALQDPANPAQKIITRASDTGRAAVKSLLATYALGDNTQHRKVALLAEFGTSLEKDAPGVFGGLAAGFGKYFRIGGGLTRQSTKALLGQKEGDVIADDNAIKTKDDWATGWYWSFSFSLTSLPLFSRD